MAYLRIDLIDYKVWAWFPYNDTINSLKSYFLKNQDYDEAVYIRDYIQRYCLN